MTIVYINDMVCLFDVLYPLRNVDSRFIYNYETLSTSTASSTTCIVTVVV